MQLNINCKINFIFIIVQKQENSFNKLLKCNNFNLTVVDKDQVLRQQALAL